MSKDPQTHDVCRNITENQLKCNYEISHLEQSYGGRKLFDKA